VSRLIQSLPERVHGLYISPQEWDQVAAILGRLIPEKRVWAFGSRANGVRLKQFSDLDVAVEGRLTWAQRSALSDAFDESLLPFKVDVVELELVDVNFRERIEVDFVVVQDGSANRCD
jgi:predicted nucleotidyltransferase